MNVIIHGPNLRDQSKGTFHVHAAGCSDNRKEVLRNGSEYPISLEADSVEAVVVAIYSDHLAEAEGEVAWYRANGQPDRPDVTWRDYEHDFHFAPCVKDLER